jgi:hypothetical protein
MKLQLVIIWPHCRRCWLPPMPTSSLQRACTVPYGARIGASAVPVSQPNLWLGIRAQLGVTFNVSVLLDLYPPIRICDRWLDWWLWLRNGGSGNSSKMVDRPHGFCGQSFRRFLTFDALGRVLGLELKTFQMEHDLDVVRLQFSCCCGG